MANKTGSGTFMLKYQNVTKAQLVTQIGKTVKVSAVGDTGATCEAEGKISNCVMFGSTIDCFVYDIRFTGSSWTGSNQEEYQSLTPDQETVDQAKNSNCSATMNGKTVYVPCSGTSTGTTSTKTDSTGTTTQSGTSSSTQNSDGTTTATDTRTTTNPDGSTTTTTTSCTGNNCTSTSTTKDASGNTTGTSTTNDTKEGFCAENPTAPVCKKSTYSAAPCGAAPACEGDPIQCAIAKQQHETACAFTNADQSLIDAGNAAANGEAQPDGHPGAAPNTSQFAFSSLIDTSSGGISGGCPQDVTVGPVTLPFSKLCSALQIMGAIAVGFSMIAAMGIVFRS